MQACVSYGVTVVLFLFVALLYICGCPFIPSESGAIQNYEAILKFSLSLESYMFACSMAIKQCV